MPSPGRPRVNPDRRFPDIAQMLDRAVGTGNFPLHFYMESKNAAIALVHRINQYRKAVRDMSHEGVTVWDAFVFRQKENVVEIAERSYANPFNMKIIDSKGNDVTARTRAAWEPIGPDGTRIMQDEPTYAIEYKRQFGVDPPTTNSKSDSLGLEIAGDEK